MKLMILLCPVVFRGSVVDEKTAQLCGDYFRTRLPVTKSDRNRCQAAGVLLLMHVSARKSKTAHKGHGEKALDADGLWAWSFCLTMCL